LVVVDVVVVVVVVGFLRINVFGNINGMESLEKQTS
jgi:hypothetical protein